MKSTISFAFLVCIAAILFTGCNNSEIGNSKDVNPETVYQQFTLSYTVGEQNFEGLAQFRFAGEDGTTLVLSEPSTVAFDNTIIKADSNDFAGAYYPVKLPAAGFYGKHQFTFIDINQKKYLNEFTINSIKPGNLPPSAYKAAPLQIAFEGLAADSNTYIEASTSGTDSSFTITFSPGGRKPFLEIPASELMRQKGKDLTLNFSVVRKIPLQNATRQGGVILLEYNLQPVVIQLEETAPLATVSGRQ